MSASGTTGAGGGTGPTATLADMICGEGAGRPLGERDWVVLVNLVAAGDQRALRQLYERTHRLAFSLIARITRSRSAAEALTIELFEDLWRRAGTYSADDGTVLAWLMGRARDKALEWLEREQALEGDILEPTTPLWGAIAKGITQEFGLLPVFTATQSWAEPEWREVAPGISCKLLASDEERARVSMLVRLAPGVDYPPHTHAGVEELHLLAGELWIDERKLVAGDYNRAEPGTSDSRVFSETGCTCVLVTSPRDVLR